MAGCIPPVQCGRHFADRQSDVIGTSKWTTLWLFVTHGQKKLMWRSRGSSVSLETRLRTGWPGFNSRQGQSWYFFLFATASIPTVGLTQSPIQWVLENLSRRVKRPRREADHSPPSSAEVTNAWSYTSAPQYVFTAWCLVKHRDTFNLTSGAQQNKLNF
jgi:hypothetical protein